MEGCAHAEWVVASKSGRRRLPGEGQRRRITFPVMSAEASDAR